VWKRIGTIYGSIAPHGGVAEVSFLPGPVTSSLQTVSGYAVVAVSNNGRRLAITNRSRERRLRRNLSDDADRLLVADERGRRRSAFSNSARLADLAKREGTHTRYGEPRSTGQRSWPETASLEGDGYLRRHTSGAIKARVGPSERWATALLGSVSVARRTARRAPWQRAVRGNKNCTGSNPRGAPSPSCPLGTA